MSSTFCPVCDDPLSDGLHGKDCSMNTSFDPTKPVETRNGRKARIVCSDMKSKYKQIVALVYDLSTDEEFVHWYRPDGHFLTSGVEHQLDLVNVPERTIRYVNLHRKNSLADSLTQNVAVRPKPYFVDGFDAIKLTYEDGKLVKVEIVNHA